MASFTFLSLTLYSILYLFNFFSTKSLITKWIYNQSFLLLTTSNSPEYANILIGLNKDIRMFVSIEWIFLLISSFFFSTATILASSITHAGKPLSLKELLSMTARSLKRPFVTLVYVTLFGVGYIFLALVTLLPLMVTSGDPFVLKALFIVLSILTAALYAYLAIIWTLALVISILEENYGIEAHGKAAKIVKGRVLHGFLVNLLITVLTYILFLGFVSSSTRLAAVQIMIGLLTLNSIWLVRMFGLMAYTVLYYQCKKSHGEEVELQWSTEHSKIHTLPLLTENIP
ncbi:hypothetical protein ACOSP7_012686 [Xanthoceras sorbifolium]